MKKILPFILVLSLFSCKPQPKQTSSVESAKATVYNTPAGDKIIFLEDYYRLYFKALKINYANRFSLYESIVQDSIFGKYFQKSEYSGLVKSTLSAPIRDTAELGNYISGVITNHEKIEELITTGLSESRKYLKNDSITVYVLPSNSDIKQKIEGMGGVAGLTAGSKQIMLTINPAINEWKVMLPYGVAHEFEHTYWTKMNFKNTLQFTLLDYLVFEGRADSYAHLIYPTVIAPWTHVMADDVEARMWNKVKSQLNNQDKAYQYSVMFGAKSEYVLWGGYTLGYHIVESALKNHPELKPIEWANLPSEKILEMSDYK